MTPRDLVGDKEEDGAMFDATARSTLAGSSFGGETNNNNTYRNRCSHGGISIFVSGFGFRVSGSLHPKGNKNPKTPNKPQ